jgi:glycerol-3-phosphate cytidylyltransferase
MRVLTMGTFDMLHPGHLGLFEWCSKIAGDPEHGARHYETDVIVAVNSDSFVKAFKKVAPRYTQAERMAMVGAIQWVDKVVGNNGYDQSAVIEEQHPDVIVVGSDWAPANGKDYLAQIDVSQEWLDGHGIAVAYVPRTGLWSSTEMRGRAA